MQLRGVLQCVVNGGNVSWISWLSVFVGVGIEAEVGVEIEVGVKVKFEVSVGLLVLDAMVEEVVKAVESSSDDMASRRHQTPSVNRPVGHSNTSRRQGYSLILSLATVNWAAQR